VLIEGRRQSGNQKIHPSSPTSTWTESSCKSLQLINHPSYPSSHFAGGSHRQWCSDLAKLWGTKVALIIGLLLQEPGLLENCPETPSLAAVRGSTIDAEPLYVFPPAFKMMPRHQASGFSNGYPREKTFDLSPHRFASGR
jgi:hypothetical protein